jgi:hypothetical protein
MTVGRSRIGVTVVLSAGTALAFRTTTGKIGYFVDSVDQQPPSPFYDPVQRD